MVREMPGFRSICVKLLLGFCSYFGFRVWLGSGCPKKLESTTGQQKEEIAQGERDDRDDSEASSVSQYDVFLSFRGPDSRQCLADVLYSDMATAGLTVFKDNKELEVGDKINKILPCIQNSKICVPIFSETFAASTWCLREVEKMVELDKEIMPIFYKVTPDDVKLRTDLFKKDLRKHVKQHGRERVQKWEDALKAACKIIGREVQSTGLAEFSRSLVSALLIKLNVKIKHVTDFLVKRDDEEEAVMKLLNTRGDVGRLVVAIHGMGGVGKTTLAKVVFNRLSAGFDCQSFLENIQESVKAKGLEYLQKQLLEDLDPKSKDFPLTDPIKMLKEKFCAQKVLVILDDVNERNQVEMVLGLLDRFGDGSRLIITTRDKRVLTEEALAFEVYEMDQDQALELFSRHAFHKDSPPTDRESLSYEAIALTGRLPLALKVIGSLLHGCGESIWKATIEKLEKIPDQDVQRKLKLSFDALTYEQKQVFLDIACFFVDMQKSKAMYMWEDCDLFPVVVINVLVSMSLLTITRTGEFWMHDLVRDLGRTIVREECPDDPTKRSRIWSHAEALEVLKIKKGKEEVRGLCMGEPYYGHLTNEECSSFSRLRLLELEETKLAGDFEHLLPQLRWFSWYRCPPDFGAINLSLRKLVVLNLAEGLMTENWAGWSLLQMAKNLKELDLSCCYNLKCTPDLSNNEAMERLILTNCHNLGEIHTSIDKLKRLKHLNLTNCCNLRSTPDFSNNKALEMLILTGCRNLAEIHTSISKLERLKHLNLVGCSSLRGLPEECGSLGNLEHILVRGNRGTFHVPESIGNLNSLSLFMLLQVRITRIPQSIGKLANLTSLCLMNCRGLLVLPDGMGNLKSLVDLNLFRTELSELPNTIGHLAKLQNLNLQSTNIEELPETVGDLKSLEKLNLKGSRLRILPNSVGNLKSLFELDMSGTNVSVLPDSIGHLENLQLLNLSSTKIEELPETVGDLKSLENLNLKGSRLRILPNSVGNLKSLFELDMSRTNVSVLPDSIGQLGNLQLLNLCSTGIEELPGTLGHLKSLNVLNVGITKLKELPGSVGELESLCKLILQRTNVSVISNCIGQLHNLQELRLSDTSIKELPNSLGALKLLEVLDISGTPLGILPDWVGGLKSLRILNLAASNVTVLPNSIGQLEQLEIMHLGATMVEQLPDMFGQLHRLRELTLHTTLIEELPDSFGALKSLKRLNLQLPRLRILPEWFGDLPKLEHLDLYGCKSRKSLSTIGKLTNLKSLSACSCTFLSEVPLEVGSFRTLEELRVGASCVAKRPPLNQLTSLNRHGIGFHTEELGCGETSLTSSLDLGALTLLEVLELDCLGFNFKCIAQLPPALKTLTLVNVTPETKLPDFSNLKVLERVVFINCSLKDLHELESLLYLQSLKHMEVSNCTEELVEFSNRLNDRYRCSIM